MASAEAAAEFERLFADRARHYLTDPWSLTDVRLDRTSRQKRTWWAWFLAEEVTTRGSFPDTQLLVIGTGDHDEACRFGFALPIWFKEGRESWDGGGWKAEGGPHAGQMLCYNVFEEAEWTVGVPTRPPCQPDESGVTWIPVSSLE